MSKEEKLNYIRFKVHRSVTELFKDFLFILEDLEDNGSISEEDFVRFRKQILTKGNNTIRYLSNKIDDLN